MSDALMILLTGVLLVALAALPGLIGFWQLGHSMVLMFVIGFAVYFWETRPKKGGK